MDRHQLGPEQSETTVAVTVVSISVIVESITGFSLLDGVLATAISGGVSSTRALYTDLASCSTSPNSLTGRSSEGGEVRSGGTGTASALTPTKGAESDSTVLPVSGGVASPTSLRGLWSPLAVPAAPFLLLRFAALELISE